MALLASFLPARYLARLDPATVVPPMKVAVARRQLLVRKGQLPARRAALAGIGIAVALLLVLALKAIFAGMEGG